MTKREARRWVRQHWATFMSSADTPSLAPDAAAEVWSEESRRCAQRLGLGLDFDLLPPPKEATPNDR